MFCPMRALILALLSAPIRVHCIQEMSVPVDLDGDQLAQLEIVDSSSSFSQRGLQDNSNCDITSSTSCIVTSENNIRCEDFFVTEETCRDITLRMTYEMCSLEQQRNVTLLQQKTVAKNFLQDLEIGWFKSIPLLPGECRSTSHTNTIDTCTIRRIVGSLKVEGHSDPSRIGYYCYAFSYYSTKVFRPSASTPTSSPTRASIPAAELEVDPNVECFIDNGRFDTTCAQYLSTVANGDPGCVVDIVYRYTITNIGSVCENINSVTSSIDGGANQVISLGNLQGRNFCPGETINVLDRKPRTRLCDLAGQEVSLEVAVNGGGNGREGFGSIIFPETDNVTPAPSPPSTSGPINYDFRMECWMETELSSAVFDVPCDMVDFKTFSPNDLRRNVMFRFIVTNMSTEPIKISELAMQSALVSGQVQIPSSNGIIIGVGGQRTWEEKFFVPFDNFNNRNVPVDATVKAVGANSAKTRDDNDSEVLSIPDLFELEVDPNADCFIDNGRFDTTCAQYLGTVSNGDPGCEVNIVFRYKITNTGSVCENISRVTSSIDGGATQDIFLGNLEIRNFCPGDTQYVLDPKARIPLCDLAGDEVSSQVAVNGGGEGREGECVILFVPVPVPTVINTSVPTRAPISNYGPINYDFRMECWMATELSSAVFDVPCDSVDFKTFSPNELRRNVMFRFIVTNKSTEPIKISELAMQSALVSGQVQIPSSNGIIIGVGGERTWTKKFFVNFDEFNNQNVPIDATVEAVGSNSANAGEASDSKVLSIPDLFELEVDPNVECFIDNGRFDITCAQYLSTKSNGDPGCVVDIVYRYPITNIGSVCENINSVTSSIDGGANQVISLGNLFGRNFCPGETINVLDRKPMTSLCKLAGQEVSLEVAVNGGGNGREGIGSISFSELNNVTPAPSPSGNFNIAIHSVSCIANIGSRSIPCDDFITQFSAFIGTNDPTCYNDITYVFKVQNVGSGCGFIQDIQTTVNGDVMPMDIDNWSQETRRFCQNESLSVWRPETSVNVCALAGTESDLSIKINNAESSGVVAYPIPNSPTPVPNPGPKDCSHPPVRMVFKFTGNQCILSINNQGKRRTRRARGSRVLRSDKGKGSSSSKKKPSGPSAPTPPAPAPTPPAPAPSPTISTPDIPVNEELYTCFDSKTVNAQSAKVTVTNLDATLLLFDGDVTKRSTFAIGDPKHLMPDDIRISVFDGNGHIVQSVKLHTSCSTVMTLGETFGSVEFVGFTNRDGTSSSV